MKIKNEFVLRQVADTYVVLPLGIAIVDFNGMITLNESGAMLWHLLEQGTDIRGLVEALTSEYSVPREEALSDVNAFLDTIRSVGCLDE